MRLFRGRGGEGAKGRGERKERSYTLVIVPDAHSRVHRFSVRERTLRLAAAAAGAAALLVVVLLVGFVRGRMQSAELGRLRAEAAAQGARSAQLVRDVAVLESGMARLRTFESRVRAAFELGAGPSGPESPPGIGGGEPSLAEAISRLGGRDAGLVDALVDRDLGQVQRRLETQEQGLAELVSFLEERRSLLASTPSLMPARGWVSSGYERRSDPFTQNEAWHRGLDISAAAGTPVVAPADGVVTAVGREPDFGNLLALDHGYGFLTRYGHASRVLVRLGQRVRRGQVVALVGNTGRSTGPHLHYEVLRHGVPVDPQEYIID
jgi:murein DD-endopeptidase MepM/ murein hydrolase activator NlpD